MYEEEHDIKEELEEESPFASTKKDADFFGDEDSVDEEEEFNDEDDLDDYGGSYGFQQGANEDQESEIGELN